MKQHRLIGAASLAVAVCVVAGGTAVAARHGGHSDAVRGKHAPKAATVAKVLFAVTTTPGPEPGYSCVEFSDASLPDNFNTCLPTDELRRSGVVMWTFDVAQEASPVRVVGMLPVGGPATFRAAGNAFRVADPRRVFMVAVPRQRASNIELARADGSRVSITVPDHSNVQLPPAIDSSATSVVVARDRNSLASTGLAGDGRVG